MKWMRSCFCLSVAALCASVAAISTVALADGPDTMSQDPNQWVIPLGNYHGTRHSKLSQVTVDNAAKLRVAWTMSTGTLRGRKASPSSLAT
jgi:lanthanide-dependent methanol dehydrogenase